MKNEITTLPVAHTSSLEFISISDLVDTNWADWAVRFEYEGIEYEGFLGACPNHPTLMHEDIIQDVEAR